MRETRQLLEREEMQMSGNQRIMSVTAREMDTFVTLLSQERIALLLEKDRCYNYVDNYLLATVFVYFKRAGLSLEEYNQANFWKCLYLAHDMEEDEDRLKWELLPWALGKNWRNTMTNFLQSKDELWARMKYRSVVSERQCKQIMSLHVRVNIWTRKRNVGHSGAVRIPGDEMVDFIPRGPEDLTPTRENICMRCDQPRQEEASEVSDKMLELLIVMDSMDIEEEEEVVEADNTDKDSGLDSSDENYMDIEIFA